MYLPTNKKLLINRIINTGIFTYWPFPEPHPVGGTRVSVDMQNPMGALLEYLKKRLLKINIKRIEKLKNTTLFYLNLIKRIEKLKRNTV